jgi:hypothetical protein
MEKPERDMGAASRPDIGGQAAMAGGLGQVRDIIVSGVSTFVLDVRCRSTGWQGLDLRRLPPGNELVSGLQPSRARLVLTAQAG